MELCEQNKELCFKINYELSCLITDVAKDLNIKLIFISTDQIYNGLKDSYSEKDTPNPINNYGISKVKSEEYILKHYSNSLIVRTNFLDGAHRIGIHLVIECLKILLQMLKSLMM